MAKKKQVPLGTFKPMTDEQIDDFTEAVDTDFIALMRTTWKRYVSKRFADLFDADEEETLDVAETI